MIRLFKLAIYAVLGYVLYEFFQGMSAGQGSPSGGGGGNRGAGGGMRRDLKRALNEGTGRMRMSGGGQGKKVGVEDKTGAARTETVGRGVTT